MKTILTALVCIAFTSNAFASRGEVTVNPGNGTYTVGNIKMQPTAPEAPKHPPGQNGPKELKIFKTKICW